MLLHPLRFSGQAANQRAIQAALRLIVDVFHVGCASQPRVVLEAACAEDAIQAVENYTEPIDLMVSDIVMPRFGGFELAKHLAPLRPAMRVLYASGYADDETVKRVQEDPTAAYLPKPFGPSDLASKVAEMISRSKESGAD
jgi:DNA-binding NarL/FixJ family response regulator